MEGDGHRVSRTCDFKYVKLVGLIYLDVMDSRAEIGLS